MQHAGCGGQDAGLTNNAKVPQPLNVCNTQELRAFSLYQLSDRN